MDDKQGQGILKDFFWYFWFFACAFFSFLALELIVGIPRMWEKHAFCLLSVWPFSNFQYELKEEILIQTALAGLMGGIGSVIFCMKELFEMLKRKLDRKEDDPKIEEFALLLPRPLFGILLAIIFFFLVKAGMVVISGAPPMNNAGDTNPGVVEAARASAAGLGGLVGMFAGEALYRLKAVSEALFMPEEKEKT